MDSDIRILLDGPLDNPIDAEEYMKKKQGYQALQKAKGMLRSNIITEIERSNLRGRGGAGFPLGRKLAAVHARPPVYMIMNLDEGEPGTFKDRTLCEQEPHKVLEGIAICAYAIKASDIYIYCRGEYHFLKNHLLQAIESAQCHGQLTEFDFHIRLGAGSYVCGEETALIESVEGRRGHPRFKPPYPGERGLWQQPTTVSNVETLANVPYIILNGWDAYARIGNPNYPGTKLISLTGDVNRAGCFEVPTDYSLYDVIYTLGQGVKGGGELLAVQVGGASGAVLTPNELQVSMNFPDFNSRGASLGSGSVFVLNETRHILTFALTLIHFFEHESCGKCTPCREGTFRARRLLEKIAYRFSAEGDLEKFILLLKAMRETSLCGLGMSVHVPLLSLIERFPEAFPGSMVG